MRTLLLVGVFGLGLVGCAKSTPAPDKIQLATVSIEQLDQMIARSECQPVDANGDTTRKRMGVIPGAVLLTDFEGYAMNELPADKAKPLVFYCANLQCGASHSAAEKALAAGYKNVKVFPDGIAGWVRAGKKIQSI